MDFKKLISILYLSKFEEKKNKIVLVLLGMR